MQPDFWIQRWADNQIGFHESQVNPLLVAHVDALNLSRGARIFLPLCGKTLDIDWLLARGFRVVGVELSSLAAMQLFERLGIAPTIERVGALERHSAAGFDLFVGDFFQLAMGELGEVDAVYDRAALIALPQTMRNGYATCLRLMSGDAPELLVTLEYDQSKLSGPPFSVGAEEVREQFAGRHVELLSRQDVPGGLKGRSPATEAVWLIRN